MRRHGANALECRIIKLSLTPASLYLHNDTLGKAWRRGRRTHFLQGGATPKPVGVVRRRSVAPGTRVRLPNPRASGGLGRDPSTGRPRGHLSPQSQPYTTLAHLEGEDE